MLANCGVMSLSSRSRLLKWKLCLWENCRRCCCAVRLMPSPSIGTVIKSLSEKLRPTRNMFSVVEGSFYKNILKYVSLRVLLQLMCWIWIFQERTNLDGFAFQKIQKIGFSGTDWVNELYGQYQRLNAYIVAVLLDCAAQPHHKRIAAISVTDLFKKEIQSTQKDSKLKCISKWERQQICHSEVAFSLFMKKHDC